MQEYRNNIRANGHVPKYMYVKAKKNNYKDRKWMKRKIEEVQ